MSVTMVPLKTRLTPGLRLSYVRIAGLIHRRDLLRGCTACVGAVQRGPGPSGGWRRETSRQTASSLCENENHQARTPYFISIFKSCSIYSNNCHSLELPRNCAVLEIVYSTPPSPSPLYLSQLHPIPLLTIPTNSTSAAHPCPSHLFTSTTIHPSPPICPLANS